MGTDAAAFHVEPGGDPTEIDLGDGTTARKLSVGPMDNNAYLLTRGGQPALLIDAAAEPQRLRTLVGDREVGVIVTTHQHHDHVGALAELAEQTGAEVVCGEPDKAGIARQTGVRCDPVWTGDVVHTDTSTADELGPVQIRLEVIGLVGHTPGSIALAYSTDDGPTHLFTGDSLFPGGPGNTAGRDDFTSLLDDLEQRVFDVYDDETLVHPGHGDSTTLGAQRPHLPTWRSRGW